MNARNMFHQVRGSNFPGILHDQEIKTTPRFYLTGRTQAELESELAPSREGGITLYKTFVEMSEGVGELLTWEKGERPAVWLTLEDGPIGSIWRLGSITFTEAETLFGGFFRIGVDTSKVEVFPWREFEQRAQASKRWRRLLAEKACGDDISKW